MSQDPWDNIDARKEPKNNPTVKVHQHLEDELTRAGAGNEGILAFTTTREAAQNFEIAWKTANAETAVKVAGATAKHCFFSTSTDAVWAWCPGHR